VASTVPFQYLMHLLTVPVWAGETETRFIVDTGIGVNLISDSLARAVGAAPSGSFFTGRRMSGQAVTAPMTSLDSVRLGDCRSRDVPAAIFDMGAMAGLDGIDGFLSLQFFRSIPVTIDYRAQVLVLEDEQSLARRAASGFPVSVQVEDDGPSTDVHLAMRLPGGRVISAEVDAGSDQLILNTALAAEAGVDLAAETVRTVDGSDETGHSFAFLHDAAGRCQPGRRPAHPPGRPRRDVSGDPTDHVNHTGTSGNPSQSAARMITKAFILAKENALISTKMLRDHGQTAFPVSRRRLGHARSAGRRWRPTGTPPARPSQAAGARRAPLR